MNDLPTNHHLDSSTTHHISSTLLMDSKSNRLESSMTPKWMRQIMNTVVSQQQQHDMKKQQGKSSHLDTTDTTATTQENSSLELQRDREGKEVEPSTTREADQQHQSHSSPDRNDANSDSPDAANSNKSHHTATTHSGTQQRNAAAPHGAIPAPLSFQMPHWLVRSYHSLIISSTLPNLSISLLNFRFLDPESPLWYLNLTSSLGGVSSQSSAQNNAHWNHAFYLKLLDELLPLVAKSTLPQNQPNASSASNSSTTSHCTVYLRHNVAILLFLVGRSTDALKLLDQLTAHTSQSTSLRREYYFILQSTVFIYIHLGMFYEASVLLTHLMESYYSPEGSDGSVPPPSTLNRHIHSIYLTMRLLDQYLNTVYFPSATEEDNDMDQHSLTDQQQSYKIPQLTLHQLLTFREDVMNFVCKSKPKNHLYKLWHTYWMKQRRKILSWDREQNSLSQSTQQSSTVGYDEELSFLLDSTEDETLANASLLSPSSEIDISSLEEPLMDNIFDFLTQLSHIYSPNRIEISSKVTASSSPPDSLSLLQRTTQQMTKRKSRIGRILGWFQKLFSNPRWSTFVGVISILSALLGFSYVMRAIRAWTHSNHFPAHPSMAPSSFRPFLDQEQAHYPSAFAEPAHTRYAPSAQNLSDVPGGNRAPAQNQQRQPGTSHTPNTPPASYSPAYTDKDAADLKRGVDNLRIFTSSENKSAATGVHPAQLSQDSSGSYNMNVQTRNQDYEYVNNLFNEIRSNLSRTQHATKKGSGNSTPFNNRTTSEPPSRWRRQASSQQQNSSNKISINSLKGNNAQIEETLRDRFGENVSLPAGRGSD